MWALESWGLKKGICWPKTTVFGFLLLFLFCFNLMLTLQRNWCYFSKEKGSIGKLSFLGVLPKAKITFKITECVVPLEKLAASLETQESL